MNRAAQMRKHAEHCFALNSETVQNLLAERINVKNGQKEMLAGNEFVFLLRSDFGRLVQNLHQFLRKIELADIGTADEFRQTRELRFKFAMKIFEINSRTKKHRLNQRLLVADKA